MARSVLDTVIRIVKEGGGDKETINSLAQVKNGFAQAGMYAAAFTGVAYTVKKVIDETVGTWSEYALGVSDASISTGIAVDDMSRLIQVADDLRISQETIVDAMEFAIRQGYEPSIEWLQATSDKMLTLKPGAERTALAIKMFGRTSGPEMVRLLEMGSDGMQDYMSSINDMMVVTEDGVQKAKAYHSAWDSVSDSWTGLTYAAGDFLALPVAEFLQLWASGFEFIDITVQGLKGGFGSFKEYIQAIADAGAPLYAIMGQIMGIDMEPAADSVEGLAAATAEADAEAKALSETYKGLIQTTMSIQNESDKYREKLENLDDKAADLREKISELEGKRWLTEDQKTQLTELNGQLEEVQTQMYEAGQEAEAAGKKLVFNLLQAKLSADGLTDAEFNLLLQTGETFGIIDAQSADAAIAINSLVGEFAAGNEPLSQFQNYIMAIMALPQRMSKEVYVQWTQEWQGGGGENWQGGQNGGNWAQQFGGDYLVTKPTVFLAGEAGPERATFTPIGSGGRYDLQPVGGGTGNGPIIVQVFLDGRMVQETIANGLAVQGI